MDYGNQEIEQEHLLYALLTQDDGLIPKMIEKMGLDIGVVTQCVEQAIAGRTKVQGGKQYVGQDLNNVLVHAEDEAKQMGDEYVSVERSVPCNASLSKPCNERNLPGDGYQ